MNQEEFEVLINLLSQFRESASTDLTTQYMLAPMQLEELEHTINTLQEQYDFIYLGKELNG